MHRRVSIHTLVHRPSCMDYWRVVTHHDYVLCCCQHSLLSQRLTPLHRWLLYKPCACCATSHDVRLAQFRVLPVIPIRAGGARQHCNACGRMSICQQPMTRGTSPDGKAHQVSGGAPSHFHNLQHRVSSWRSALDLHS